MFDMVQRRRLLLGTIGLLVIMNLAMMGSIYWHKQDQKPTQSGLELFLEQELSLTPLQVQTMHSIRKQHFESARPLAQALRDSSDLLILQAFLVDLDTSRATVIAENIGRIHAQLDMALYDHFVQLNRMCTPEQKIRLLELSSELLGSNQPPPPGGQPPPGGKPAFGNRPPPPGAQHPPGGGPPPRDR